MFTLANLPYESTALEPFLDQATVLLHHDKHHQTYVDKLNELLAEFPEFSEYSSDQDLVNLMKNINSIPENKRTAIFNNAGQVYNHNLYWNSLINSTDSQKFEMSPEFATQIDKFESYENFQKLWTSAGLTQFGSGWVWLSVNPDGGLVIEKTGNGDNPIFHGQSTPIMTMDVWEHAYYLKYQNKRAAYIENFFNIIDWNKVSQRYDEVVKISKE